MKDRPARPADQPVRDPLEIETLILGTRQEHQYGAVRLHHLKQHHLALVSEPTILWVLKENQARGYPSNGAQKGKTSSRPPLSCLANFPLCGKWLDFHNRNIEFMIEQLLNVMRQKASRVQNLLHRLNSFAIVLMYHRIAAPAVDPFSLCVSPANFADHLSYIRQHYCPLSLEQLSQALISRRIPRRCIVVTLDDGYADNLNVAKPLLEATDVPATCFITTGLLDNLEGFWWDRLTWIMLEQQSLPPALSLTIGGQELRWILSQSSSHYKVCMELNERLWTLDEGERERVLSDLARWANLPQAEFPVSLPLTTGELEKLVSDGLIEIGSHTVSHPALGLQPIEVQRRELLESKKQLEAIVERPVTSFAYPYGHATGETIRLVREAGYAIACSTARGIVAKGTDPFWIPRSEVLNLDGDRFAAKLWQLFRTIGGHL